MHGLVMALLTSILVVDYLVDRLHLLNRYFVLLPEALSAIAMIVVLARLMNGARLSFDWRYALFFAVLLFTIVFGFTVQDVPDGAMLAGTRSYLKYLPFFLLPAVHRFTARQISVQLLTVLVLALLQTPLAVFQRFVQFAESMHSGDPIRGTLTTSSAMSLFLLAAIAGVVILHLRGKLKLATLLLAAAWLFLPTTINETKATLFLLPAALLGPALLVRGRKRTLRRLLPLATVGTLAVVAFVGVYNHFIQYRQYPDALGEFMTGDRLSYYLYTGAANADTPYVGRFDSIEIALEHTAEDPYTLAFGFGAGNVAESFLPAFNGRYADYFERFGVGQTQVTTFLWEIGVVGLLAYLFLFYAVTRDSLTLARSHDSAALLGQLWVIVMVIMTFGLLYKSLFTMNDLGYLFWYFSGVVAARAATVRERAKQRVPHRLPPNWRLAIEGPRAAAKG